jgi:dihydrofolate reductase
MICNREISLICAITSDGYIGVDGDLCIKSPTDLAFFKEMTMGKAVIMGRKTYNSLPAPLHGRKTVIIGDKNKLYLTPHEQLEGKHDYPSIYEYIHDALIDIDTDVVFIGGQRIFDEGVEYCDTVYMTVFDNECRDGDKVKLTFDEKYLKMYSFTKERLFLIDDIDKNKNHITGQVFKFTRNWY